MPVFLLLGLLFVPSVAQAAITINEVAWMGSEDSANDEWIELHNTGSSPVSVDGWTLEDGMNLSIELEGIINAGDYVVLERTDDSSAPGAAFLVYTGALTNVGATLSLLREDASIEDRIAGGEDWKDIGGDNITKETAQYTTSGWITAGATPGSKNAQEPSNDLSDGDNSSQDNFSSAQENKKDERTTLVLPDDELSLQIASPEHIYVNQKISFTVEPLGVQRVVKESLEYEWNFGDLHTATGKEVSHAFTHPGEYLVAVSGAFARHEAVGMKAVTVLPMSISMTATHDSILLHNDARYQVDVSGYKLIGPERIEFPNNSMLLPNATLAVPFSRLGIVSSPVVSLYDQVGNRVTSLNKITTIAAHEESAPPTNPVFIPQTTSRESDSNSNEQFSFEDEEEFEQLNNLVTDEMNEDDSETQQLAASVIDSDTNLPGSWPLYALVGMIGVMLLLLYTRKV